MTPAALSATDELRKLAMGAIDDYTHAWKTWRESDFDIEVFKDVSHADARLTATVLALLDRIEALEAALKDLVFDIERIEWSYEKDGKLCEFRCDAESDEGRTLRESLQRAAALAPQQEEQK